MHEKRTVKHFHASFCSVHCEKKSLSSDRYEAASDIKSLDLEERIKMVACFSEIDQSRALSMDVTTVQQQCQSQCCHL